MVAQRPATSTPRLVAALTRKASASAAICSTLNVALARITANHLNFPMRILLVVIRCIELHNLRSFVLARSMSHGYSRVQLVRVGYPPEFLLVFELRIHSGIDLGVLVIMICSDFNISSI